MMLGGSISASYLSARGADVDPFPVFGTPVEPVVLDPAVLDGVARDLSTVDVILQPHALPPARKQFSNRK